MASYFEWPTRYCTNCGKLTIDEKMTGELTMNGSWNNPDEHFARMKETKVSQTKPFR